MSDELEPISLEDVRAGPDFGLPRTDEGYRVIGISRLRNSLGLACRMVAGTDEPLVVQRYRRQDVVIVPLWMWRQLIDLAHQTPEEEEPHEAEPD